MGHLPGARRNGPRLGIPAAEVMRERSDDRPKSLSSPSSRRYTEWMRDAADSRRDSESAALGPHQRWALFEKLCGDQIRARDAAWAAGLAPAARVAVADDLLATIRAVRVVAGDWQAVDDRAWRETLAERVLQLKAFRRLDEVTHGTGPVADAG